MGGLITKRNMLNRKKQKVLYFSACLFPMRFGHHAKCARKILDYRNCRKPKFL